MPFKYTEVLFTKIVFTICVQAVTSSEHDLRVRALRTSA
jgi:hypothetical protein